MYTVHDFLKNTKGVWKGVYQYEGLESLLTLDNDAVKGSISGMQLMPGLCILKNDLELKKPLNYNQKIPFNYLKISFYIDADLTADSVQEFIPIQSGYHKFGFFDHDREVKLGTNQKRLKSFDIVLRLGLLTAFMKEKTNLSPKIIDQVKQGLAHNQSYLVQTPPAIKDRIEKIWDNQHFGLYKVLTTQSKTCELLFDLLSWMENEESQTPANYCTMQLEEAKVILEQRYQRPPTIKLLSREVGINENKLKQEFKRRYNTTIYQYVAGLRMQHSRKMLYNEHVTINEIAENTGYQNTSKFISAFKKQYGVTPGQFRSRLISA